MAIKVKEPQRNTARAPQTSAQPGAPQPENAPSKIMVVTRSPDGSFQPGRCLGRENLPHWRRQGGRLDPSAESCIFLGRQHMGFTWHLAEDTRGTASRFKASPHPPAKAREGITLRTGGGLWRATDLFTQLLQGKRHA